MDSKNYVPEWKNVKQKVFGGYIIKKKKNSYDGISVENDENKNGKKDKFSVWKTPTLDAAFEKEDINPFIAAAQHEAQARQKRIGKEHYEMLLENVRKQYKKKTGKDISIFLLKKKIKEHAELLVRKNAIQQSIDEIRKNKDRDLQKEYENAKFGIDEETSSRVCEINGEKRIFDEESYEIDKNLGLLPEDITEFELWELYGRPLLEKNKGEENGTTEQNI